MKYTRCMHNSGISYDLMQTQEQMRCPRCDFEFNLMYSRAFACVGCRYAVMGCDAVRCPKCDLEFKIKDSGHGMGKESAQHIANVISKIMKDHGNDFGESPAR